MDAKITLSFDAETIASAKAYAEANNISLSRLTEYLYRRITTPGYSRLEDLPISDWVMQVAEGQAEYIRTPPSAKKEEFYEHRKK